MKKPALILLHGALGAAEQFAAWTEMLQAHFEVYTLDFEGHGKAPAAGRPFAIENFAENLRDLIQSQNLGPARIFGYSMGGYVALLLAARHPELVDRVFTFASKLDWSPEIAAREVKMLNADKIEAKVPRFAKMLEQRHIAHPWRSVLQATAEMMQALGQHNPIDSLYGDIQCRVRLGIGDRDSMVSLEETVGAQNRIDGAELLVLPATPHPLEKISPERMLPQLLDFFA